MADWNENTPLIAYLVLGFWKIGNISVAGNYLHTPLIGKRDCVIKFLIYYLLTKKIIGLYFGIWLVMFLSQPKSESKIPKKCHIFVWFCGLLLLNLIYKFQFWAKQSETWHGNKYYSNITTQKIWCLNMKWSTYFIKLWLLWVNLQYTF